MSRQINAFLPNDSTMSLLNRPSLPGVRLLWSVNFDAPVQTFFVLQMAASTE